MSDVPAKVNIAVLPGDPPTMCPDLLTEKEAIRYLRLDETSAHNPADSLRHYRKKGRLRATQVGRNVRYRRVELDRFLERQTEENPR